MGCILSAASCNKWFCEEILGTLDFETEQQSITDEHLGNNDVFFLPYLMGERSPINDIDARGAFIGMNMATKRQDMVQAVLEGVAFAVRDNFEIAKQAGIVPFAMKKYQAQAKRFTEEELRMAVEECVSSEEAVKTGAMNDRMSVELLILKYSRFS